MYDNSEAIKEIRKTYAFFDVIGVKKAIESGDASKLLSEFWKRTDLWGNQRSTNIGWCHDKNDNEVIPFIYLRVFSDSAILYTNPELVLEDFYRIATDLYNFIKENGLQIYCIINRDMETLSEYSTGGVKMDEKYRPNYERIVGTGSAWFNVFKADHEISDNPKIRDWHKKYNMYCLKDENIAKGYRSVEHTFIDGFKGDKVKLNALKQDKGNFELSRDKT